MPELQILIVEDEPLIAEDIAGFLKEMDFNPIGIAYDSETALDMLATRRPDLALLDINIEGSKNGIDIANIIRTNYNIPFIFLTSFSNKETLDEAKKTIPYGYIVKPFNEHDLLSTIEMAVFRHANESNDGLPTFEEINGNLSNYLTKKEYECLFQIFEGLTNQQMADKQYVSINTIKTHVKNLFSKLQVSNRTAAIQKVINT